MTSMTQMTKLMPVQRVIQLKENQLVTLFLVINMCFQPLFSTFNIYICGCYNYPFCMLFANAAPRKEVRKKTIGVGLEKMIKRGNKLPIQVAEGKKRPDVPHQAAKLASETGVALRDKLPIYTS
jgi:hypothetical protein